MPLPITVVLTGEITDTIENSENNLIFKCMVIVY